MNKYKLYRRKETFELRDVTTQDIEEYKEEGTIKAFIRQVDKDKGSPKIGDKIARNTKNIRHQWLIEEETFKSDWEEV